MKSKWMVAAVCVLVLAGGACMYGYLYKGARDIRNEDAKYIVTSLRLLNDFTDNTEGANKKYLNATLEVKGVVTQVSDSVLMLDSTIFCGLNYPLKNNILNRSVTVKGRCIGFDELFNEVKLDECSIKE